MNHLGSTSRPPRVLLGNLEPMVRLGMCRVFEEAGVDVVGEEEHPEKLLRMAERLHPDVIVLELLQEVTRELSERIRAASPGTKVILWTRDEELMEVLDPGATVPRRFFQTVPEGLRKEVSSSHMNQVED